MPNPLIAPLVFELHPSFKTKYIYGKHYSKPQGFYFPDGLSIELKNSPTPRLTIMNKAHNPSTGFYFQQKACSDFYDFLAKSFGLFTPAAVLKEIN